MSKPLTIDIEGLSELIKKLGSIPAETIALVDAELGAAADEFVNLAAAAAPHDRGELISKITADKKEVMNYEVVSAAEYSAFIEWGTRSRVKVPDDLQSYAAQFKGTGSGDGEGFFKHIFEWVKRKGIRYESAGKFKSGAKKGQNRLLTLEQTAYIIYHYLLLTGINPHPFFFIQREPVRKSLQQRISPAVSQALNR